AVGEPFLTLETKPNAIGSRWAAQVPPLEALASGAYTAVAEQTELEILGSLGETTKTPAVSFEVDTEAPKVSITKGPEARSNKTTPPFEGTASEETEVTVHVFEGANQVATATTTAAGGNWSTSTLSPALPTGKHTFTAYATEESGIGNEPGKSNEVSFEVDTEAPKVAITKGPEARSNKTTPPFEGTASEPTEVTVHVFEGLSEVAKAKTVASAGHWSTSTLSPALPTGKHSFTAYATEASAIGNEPGKSNEVSFEVDTES